VEQNPPRRNAHAQLFPKSRVCQCPDSFPWSFCPQDNRLAVRWARTKPRSLCSPNSSVSRSPKFFSVPAVACSQARTTQIFKAELRPSLISQFIRTGRFDKKVIAVVMRTGLRFFGNGFDLPAECKRNENKWHHLKARTYESVLISQSFLRLQLWFCAVKIIANVACFIGMRDDVLLWHDEDNYSFYMFTNTTFKSILSFIYDFESPWPAFGATLKEYEGIQGKTWERRKAQKKKQGNVGKNREYRGNVN